MHTTTEFFESVVLDSHVLSVAIVNRCDTLADDPEYSPEHYHKAAYRQWAMWQHSYLGRSNIKVTLCSLGGSYTADYDLVTWTEMNSTTISYQQEYTVDINKIMNACFLISSSVELWAVRAIVVCRCEGLFFAKTLECRVKVVRQCIKWTLPNDSGTYLYFLFFITMVTSHSLLWLHLIHYYGYISLLCYISFFAYFLYLWWLWH